MASLTSEQLRKIEENRAKALLKRQQTAQTKTHPSAACVPTPSQFYGNRNFSGPVKPTSFPLTTRPVPGSSGQNSKAQNGKLQTCTKVDAVCALINSERFCVKMPFHDKSIAIMKTIEGRIFDQATKCWTFPITEHDAVVGKLRLLKPEVSVSALPRNVVNCLRNPPPNIADVDIDKIDETLLATLLPFQAEGIRFGVSRKGRCLIADEMGLGKSLQALGIAHYYEDKWPLLIVCPSSMRFPWEQCILEYAPSVNPFSIAVMTAASDDILSQRVIIVSYDLLKTSLPVLKRKKFGIIIFDESHYIKNIKSARTEAALQISCGVPHVILLSGTPALSRPQEIYPQLRVIDPAGFSNFHEFGIRYCDGKQKKFGWDFSGSSNSQELEMLLKGKFMIRRMKADVFEQMPSKIRKVVYLQPKIIKALSNQMEAYATQIEKTRGTDQRSTMLEWYSATAPAKLEAVTSYIEDKLASGQKMLIFAHHGTMLDGISVMLAEKKVDFIRIDGSTPSERRSELCDKFQTCPSVRVAVLSLKAANAGITLTAACLVLFAELYWNPGELTQAEDRAHRIGQNESVLVEYLVAKGTADDYLIKLVGDKLNVLNRCGLSKENFRNMQTTSPQDKRQKTLREMLKACDGPTSSETIGQPESTANTDVTSEESMYTGSQVADLFSEDFDSMEDAFKDDDVFDSIDLAAIEGEYQMEAKRQKLES